MTVKTLRDKLYALRSQMASKRAFAFKKGSRSASKPTMNGIDRKGSKNAIQNEEGTDTVANGVPRQKSNQQRYKTPSLQALCCLDVDG
jgi:hypothetical protein